MRNERIEQHVGIALVFEIAAQGSMIVTCGFEDRYGSDPRQRFHLSQTVLQCRQSVGRMNDIETAAVRSSSVQEDLGFAHPFGNIPLTGSTITLSSTVVRLWVAPLTLLVGIASLVIRGQRPNQLQTCANK